MTVKYFFDLMSQPSRALYIFFKVANIPFEACPVALRKGEHLSEDFKVKYNRFQKVPFIHDGDFRLGESVAIVKYLANKNNVADPWYPKDLQKRARVDEYLDWQHLNTRAFCALYFRKKWLEPLMTGKQPDEKSVKTLEKNMVKCLDEIENIWLADNQKFLTGDTISVADIFAACEIEQPRLAKFNPVEGRPKLKAWLERVKEGCSPHYQEAHKILEKMIVATSKL